MPPPGGYSPPAAFAGGALPPGQSAGAVAGTLDAGQAIGYGWKGFVNNIGPLALIAVVVLAINLVMGWISRAFNNTFMDLIIGFVSWVVSLIIALGLIRAALAILDGRRPTPEVLLSTDRLLPYAIASIIVGIIVFVGLILCVVPGLIATFLFWFFGYAVVDAPDEPGSPARDPIAAMKRSYEVASANVGSLLLLAILCVLINILGAILCGIGLLVSLPVTAIATAYAWRVLTHGVVAQQP